MRDVSQKIKTLRTATARAVLRLSPETLVIIREGRVPKGNPLEVAKVAAVQAAKNTSQIIPYCHPLPIDFVGVEYELKENAIEISVTVKAIYKTGVEMEALTAASVAALTIYDMTKMLDEAMEIGSITLLHKKGGKSDFREGFARPLRGAVLVLSDSISAGKKSDESGLVIRQRLSEHGIDVADYRIISDDEDGIVETLADYADKDGLDLIVTTGGTGTSPRDRVPEAMARVIEREIPGISETTRVYGQERMPYAMLSRGKAGIRGKTLIINLPGSKNGVAESLDALFPAVLHAFKMMRGGCHRAEELKITN